MPSFVEIGGGAHFCVWNVPIAFGNNVATGYKLSYTTIVPKCRFYREGKLSQGGYPPFPSLS